jgi:SAM-dependent methyltransferase
MIEHDILVHPGQLVAVEQGTALPRIVYRWPDIVVAQAEDGDYALTREGKPVQADALRVTAFPEIEAMYARREKAEDVDPRQVVREGYDRIAERYVAWVQASRSAVRMCYTRTLLDALPPGADVLDLGCGAGGPTTLALAGRFALTGVDMSARSIALARLKVPGATFIEADMAEVDFAAGSFDGVAAFYSLIHVPRDLKGALLEQIASWLRPGGMLVATMGTHAEAVDYGEDFLGVPMYWSTFDSETNRRLVEQAGFEIVSARQETEEEDGQLVTFLWVIARKPALEENL